MFASRAEDWAPLSLLALLFVLATASELMNVEVRGLRLSGSFLSIVLAMALLGPAPAVALGVASVAVDCALSRRSVDRVLVNFATFATFPLVGGVAIVWLTGDFDPAQGDALGFAGVVLAVFMATNVLNFLMVATATHYAHRVSPRDLAAVLRHRAALGVRDRTSDGLASRSHTDISGWRRSPSRP